LHFLLAVEVIKFNQILDLLMVFVTTFSNVQQICVLAEISWEQKVNQDTTTWNTELHKCSTFPVMGSSTLDIFLQDFNSSILFCNKGFNLDTGPKQIVLLCIQISRFYGLYLTVWLGTSTSQATWRTGRVSSSGSSELGCYQAQSRWLSVGVARLATWAVQAFKLSVLMNWQVTSWLGWGGRRVQHQKCDSSVVVKCINVL
jgi:hypothetical protein